LELVDRHGIPGAVVGVAEDGRIEAEAAGIANLNSGVAMPPDTLPPWLVIHTSEQEA
jgi:hypothetical protein